MDCWARQLLNGWGGTRYQQPAKNLAGLLVDTNELGTNRKERGRRFGEGR